MGWLNVLRNPGAYLKRAAKKAAQTFFRGYVRPSKPPIKSWGTRHYPSTARSRSSSKNNALQKAFTSPKKRVSSQPKIRKQVPWYDKLIVGYDKLARQAGNARNLLAQYQQANRNKLKNFIGQKRANRIKALPGVEEYNTGVNQGTQIGLNSFVNRVSRGTSFMVHLPKNLYHLANNPTSQQKAVHVGKEMLSAAGEIITEPEKIPPLAASVFIAYLQEVSNKYKSPEGERRSVGAARMLSGLLTEWVAIPSKLFGLSKAFKPSFSKLPSRENIGKRIKGSPTLKKITDTLYGNTARVNRLKSKKILVPGAQTGGIRFSGKTPSNTRLTLVNIPRKKISDRNRVIINGKKISKELVETATNLGFRHPMLKKYVDDIEAKIKQLRRKLLIRLGYQERKKLNAQINKLERLKYTASKTNDNCAKLILEQSLMNFFAAEAQGATLAGTSAALSQYVSSFNKSMKYPFTSENLLDILKFNNYKLVKNSDEWQKLVTAYHKANNHYFTNPLKVYPVPKHTRNNISPFVRRR
jgi:hypothetical protein